MLRRKAEATLAEAGWDPYASAGKSGVSDLRLISGRGRIQKGVFVNRGVQTAAGSALGSDTRGYRHRAGLCRVVAGCGLQLLIAGVLASCGGTSSEPKAPSDPAQRTVRDTRIIHEPCDVGGSGGTDVNGDGRVDLVVERAGAWEKCTAADLNFDGVWDTYVYKARDGVVRRRETDFDRDGRIDEITTFEGGVIATKFSATTLGGKLDTWRYYQNGRPFKAERDADGDAAIDQWWEFPKGSDCPLIHTDVDGDGRPDPGATVDLCVATGDSDPDDSPDDQRFGSGPADVLTETVEGEEAPAGSNESPASPGDDPDSKASSPSGAFEEGDQ